MPNSLIAASFSNKTREDLYNHLVSLHPDMASYLNHHLDLHITIGYIENIKPYQIDKVNKLINDKKFYEYKNFFVRAESCILVGNGNRLALLISDKDNKLADARSLSEELIKKS